MKIFNKHATYDYEILDRFEAGIALSGPEVKSIREGRVRLDTAFVRIIGTGMVLVNAEIMPYAFARIEGYDPKRTRNLLMHTRELLSLKHKMDAGNVTLIPVSLYTKGTRIKLEVGLARGKKQFEKRETIKNRQLKRELEVNFRGKIR